MARDHSVEERRTHRVRSKGSVSGSDRGRWIRGRIIDLSNGGVRISVEHRCREHQDVNVDLSFDASPSTHYALTGHTRRASAHELSIEFDVLAVTVARVLVEELV